MSRKQLSLLGKQYRLIDHAKDLQAVGAITYITAIPCLSDDAANSRDLVLVDTLVIFVTYELNRYTSEGRVPEQNTANLVRFEIFTAVTMKNCVFWDVTPCASCNNRRFGGT
jgi:hypothetical protein